MSVDIQSISVEPESVGTRLDSFLASRIAELSRTRVQKAIEDGDVLVNERASKPGYRLRAGDRIEVDLPEPPPVEIAPEPIELKVVFEDEDLIVVDKAAGMVVHPGAGVESGTLANALVHHFNQLSSSAGSIRPGIVHRIDRETSGLLVVAKNDVAHERLSDQFRDRLVFKMYTALVYGRFLEDRGEIESRIGRSHQNRTRMSVLAGDAGRSAHTLFEVERRYTEFTLLNVQIKTGRTHQIRVHMSHLNHPVVGDRTYGHGRENTVSRILIRQRINALGRHFLHSSRLAINQPRTGERLEFVSPLPPELENFLRGLD
ncbi:MAG TPA: RluA family pseudouridine synthase [Blastocatellia bacterium]|nr:RluA family pseudouridine synthase [Blastocatellia bacterium]